MSYHRQIRPILQANCQGCHQPAKQEGGYVMTEVALMKSAGDSGSVGIAPGKPDTASSFPSGEKSSDVITGGRE